MKTGIFLMRTPLPATYVPINGRRTSIRIEPQIWRALRRAATEQGMSAKAFIERVSRNKDPNRSLASELRVAVCGHFVASAPELGFFDPQTRFALRVVDGRPRRKRRSARCCIRREVRDGDGGLNTQRLDPASNATDTP
jgi:predicted DNA-binding ribbon-helix-helix protein